MSSNRSKAARSGRHGSAETNQGKKVRSISRRLALSRVRHKIGASFAKDVLVLLAIFATWLIVLEVSATGKLDFRNNDY